MSDERQHTDSELLMRSILADAQEEVPAHIWEGVSEELDRIDVSKRKMFAPWLRRSAVAVAAAAVVVCGLVIDWKDDENTLVPEAVIPEMVAVVETITEKPDTTTTQEFDRQHFTPKYIADAGVAAKESCPVCIEAHISGITHDHDMTDAKTLSAEQDSNVQKEYFPEEWPEEEYKKRHRTNTAIVLSGIAGTNSVTNNHGTGFIKFPSISTIKPQTGVKQTSEDSSYGLPLSIGAGVKIGVSERWAIGTGISYTMLSRKFQGYYTHVDEEGKIEVSPPSDIRNTQHYLGIPITAYYNIVNQEHISFYAYAGGAVERCISNKYHIQESNIVHNESAKGVQFSANVGIGVEFALGKHLGLYIDPSLRYYFNNSQPKSIRTVQPWMMGLEMGLRVNL